MPSTLEEIRKTASTRTRKASSTRTRRTSTTRTRKTTTTRRRKATTTRKTRASTKTKAIRKRRRRIRRRMAMGAAAAAAATAIDQPLLLRMCMQLPNNQVFHVWGVKRACSSPVSFSLRPIFTFKKKRLLSQPNQKPKKTCLFACY